MDGLDYLIQQTLIEHVFNSRQCTLAWRQNPQVLSHRVHSVGEKEGRKVRVVYQFRPIIMREGLLEISKYSFFVCFLPLAKKTLETMVSFCYGQLSGVVLNNATAMLQAREKVSRHSKNWCHERLEECRSQTISLRDGISLFCLRTSFYVSLIMSATLNQVLDSLMPKSSQHLLCFCYFFRHSPVCEFLRLFIYSIRSGYL